MCTNICENKEITGSGLRDNGWFKVKEARVSFEHPFNLQSEYSLNIDLVNDDLGLDARVGIELTPESARRLMATVESVLSQGEKVLGSDFLVALR